MRWWASLCLSLRKPLCKLLFVPLNHNNGDHHDKPVKRLHSHS